MSAADALTDPVLFNIGVVPVTGQVVTTWGLMAVLALASWLLTRRLRVRAGRLQMLVEALVVSLSDQVREVIDRDPTPYLPLLASLFLFITTASLSALLPGVQAPTAHIETPAALALVVFLATHAFGLREQGVANYLRGYLKPSPLLLPLNLLAELTRTFSLMVRLLGNMLSHEIVIAVMLLMAGLLVPVPFMLLGVLIGFIQAYIFTVLATVYIGAAIGAVER